MNSPAFAAQAPFAIFAGLLGTWFGAALFYAAIVGPAAVEAGRSGVGFLQALARRHGTGLFYAVLAFLTVIAGLWTYFANGIYQLASASNLWATLAVGLAIIALLLGASANRIAERKWVNAVKNVNFRAHEFPKERDWEFAGSAELARHFGIRHRRRNPAALAM